MLEKKAQRRQDMTDTYLLTAWYALPSCWRREAAQLLLCAEAKGRRTESRRVTAGWSPGGGGRARGEGRQAGRQEDREIQSQKNRGGGKMGLKSCTHFIFRRSKERGGGGIASKASSELTPVSTP